MDSNRRVKSSYLVLSAPKPSAEVFHFAVRNSRKRGQCRLKELQRENALLSSIVAETRVDILRLRRLLIES